MLPKWPNTDELEGTGWVRPAHYIAEGPVETRSKRFEDGLRGMRHDGLIHWVPFQSERTLSLFVEKAVERGLEFGRWTTLQADLADYIVFIEHLPSQNGRIWLAAFERVEDAVMFRLLI